MISLYIRITDQALRHSDHQRPRLPRTDQSAVKQNCRGQKIESAPAAVVGVSAVEDLGLGEAPAAVVVAVVMARVVE